MSNESPFLPKAQKYCDYQERCQQEVRDKLYAWGLSTPEVEQLIAHLIEQDYLNEERYARAFARGKFRIKQWGKIRIARELKLKKISDYCIRQALSEISDHDYEQTLSAIIHKKEKELRGNAPRVRQQKIIAYAYSRGFDANDTRRLLSEPTDDDYSVSW